MDCIFCKIIAGEIPSSKVFENEKVLAFKDINPQAPVHIIVIPKQHIKSMDEINESNCNILCDIGLAISQIAKEQGLENGYRVITNVGEDGAQSVKHLHFHILGGVKLTEKLS
ncbi:MAG: histidine triad nucleotide-binding protein [Oscillospiraceae bacterium]